MGTFSIWHWLIVGLVVLLLFGGAGKIPRLMRDMGQGVNAFKKGLKESKEDEAEAEDRKSIEKDATAEAAPAEEKEREKTGTDA